MGISSWKYGKPLADEGAVERLATALGVALPPEYAATVQQYDGGRPQPRVFDFPGQRGAVMQRLLSVGAAEESGGVLRVMRNLGDRLPAGYIPFAEDPFGNFLCFRYPATGNVAVHFWDHETGTAAKVCNDFSELLALLHE